MDARRGRTHTVTETGGASLESFAFNGRVFVSNTPTIVARTGKRIRWYVFNLDLGRLAQPTYTASDGLSGMKLLTRAVSGRRESVADTTVPPVILLPLDEDCHSHKEHRHNKECGCAERVGHRHVQKTCLADGRDGALGADTDTVKDTPRPIPMRPPPSSKHAGEPHHEDDSPKNIREAASRGFPRRFPRPLPR